MKLTVSLLLLVAIGRVEPSGKQEEDDNQSAKRELLQGNYGLRIQPSVLVASNSLVSQQVDSESSSQKKYPAQEYGPSRYPDQEYTPPVAKISDVLMGQGPPFSVAIADHLYSPVSIYQPRLGSFEISPPVPSQLRYAEHKIISDNFHQTLKQNFESLKQPQFSIAQHQNKDRQENLGNTNEIFGSSPRQPSTITDGNNFANQKKHILNFEPQKINQDDETSKQKPPQKDNIGSQHLQNVQNFESAKQTETQQQKIIFQQNTFPVFSEIRSPHLNLADAFLPRLEQFKPQSPPVYAEQIIQQIFPQFEGYSQDFFQQINELGNQLSHNTVQYYQYSDDDQNNAEKEEKQDQEIEDDKSIQQLQSTTEKQINTTLPSTSTPLPVKSTKPQAVSYARFSLGLPLTSSNIQKPSQQLHQVSSSTPLQELKPLLQPNSQQLFNPLLQAQIIQPLQQLQLPQLFQPVPQLSPQPIDETAPQLNLQPVSVQPLFLPLPPQSTQQPLTSAATFLTPFTAKQPQRIGVIRIRQETTLGNQPTLTTSTQNQETFSTRSQNQDLFTTLLPQFSSSPQITLDSESTKGTKTKILSNEVPVSTTIVPRSTSESFSQSTEIPTTTTPVSIVSKFVSKVSTNTTTPPFSIMSTSTPQVLITPTSSPALPPRPDLELPISTISTPIQPYLTSGTISQSSEKLIHHTTQPKTHPVQDFISEQTIQPLPPLEPFPTLPPYPPLQPLPTLEKFGFPLAPPQFPPAQPYFAAPQPLPTLQPFPQPLPTLQPYLIQPLLQPQTPAITANPIHRYQMQTENQQIQAQQQQGLLQLVPVRQVYQAQIQLQPTPSPPPQQLQIQVQPQLEQRLSQFQPAPQPQSHQQSPNAVQNQSNEKKQSQYGDLQVSQHSEKNEAAIAHAHQLLYGLYSPFIQQPVSSEAQDIVIQPQASIAYPATSSHPTLFSNPALSSPQFYGIYAHDIFGGQLRHYKKK